MIQLDDYVVGEIQDEGKPPRYVTSKDKVVCSLGYIP